MNQNTENVQANRSYKVINIITPSVSSDKALQIVSANLVLKDGERIVHQHMSMRNFAYNIFKHASGHYIVTDIEASPSTVNELSNKMRLNESFLRTMILSNAVKFNISDESFIKRLASCTTKRGRMVFPSNRYNRQAKKSLSQSIKIARILGLLPFCNYNA